MVKVETESGDRVAVTIKASAEAILLVVIDPRRNREAIAELTVEEAEVVAAELVNLARTLRASRGG